MYQSGLIYHSCWESYYLVSSDFNEAALVSAMMKVWANRPGFTRLEVQAGQDSRCWLIGRLEGTNLLNTGIFNLCYFIVSRSSFSLLNFPLSLVCEFLVLPGYF